MTSSFKMLLMSGLVMLDIELWDKGLQKYRDMSVTLDTGASVTTISTDLLRILGYDVSTGKEKKIITASGIAYVRSIIMDRVKLGNHVVNDVEVYAHTFPASSFSWGVLGLNVLQEFDINLLFSKKMIDITLHSYAGG